jgi:uncharacterized protein YjbI with pentapeptide repeats
MANSEHIEVLQQGAALWNAWHREHPDVRPDFGKADLYVEYLNKLSRSIRNRTLLYFDSDKYDKCNDVDCDELDKLADRDAEEGEELLRPNEFGWPRRGADLRGVDFSGADLTDSTLIKADLSWANLSNADLSGADSAKRS